MKTELEHAFKAGRISDNTTFEEWYNTFASQFSKGEEVEKYPSTIKNIPDKIYLVINDEDKGKDFDEIEHEFTFWSPVRTCVDDIEFSLSTPLASEERKPLSEITDEDAIRIL